MQQTTYTLDACTSSGKQIYTSQVFTDIDALRRAIADMLSIHAGVSMDPSMPLDQIPEYAMNAGIDLAVFTNTRTIPAADEMYTLLIQPGTPDAQPAVFVYPDEITMQADLVRRLSHTNAEVDPDASIDDLLKAMSLFLTPLNGDFLLAKIYLQPDGTYSRTPYNDKEN